MKINRREWIQTSWQASVLGAPMLLIPKLAARATQDVRKRLRSGKAVFTDELPTPSLLLDVDALEANIESMSRHARNAAVQLRPHAKTHKCAEIARRQIRAGALGVCTATIHEAEALAAADISGILITSELVGRNKITRLVELTRRRPDTLSIVDSPEQAVQLSQAASAAKVTLNLLIDVDPGGRRTGVPAGEKVVRLAETISGLSHLKLRGIHCYSGASAHVVGFEERRAHSVGVMAAPLESFAQLKRAGMALEIFSGGSTGTYNIDPALEGMTELQVGSYVFMDVDYRRIGGQRGPVYDDFLPSLSVVATVISKNHEDRATVDAGYKAFATDRKFGPEIKGCSGVEFQFGGDEHGVLLLKEPSREIQVGDRLEFLVPHCDPNVNLYTEIYCVRGARVEDVWPVTARGHS
ncbi:MAG: DSD1 family PLP-dependent enzyme [Acidobacteriota bacterium]